jgi:hypothetical protein
VSDVVLVALVTAVANGLVTWGVVSTKLAWMRRDIDDLRGEVKELRERVA